MRKLGAGWFSYPSKNKHNRKVASIEFCTSNNSQVNRKMKVKLNGKKELCQMSWNYPGEKFDVPPTAEIHSKQIESSSEHHPKNNWKVIGLCQKNP